MLLGCSTVAVANWYIGRGIGLAEVTEYIVPGGGGQGGIIVHRMRGT